MANSGLSGQIPPLTSFASQVALRHGLLHSLLRRDIGLLPNPRSYSVEDKGHGNHARHKTGQQRGRADDPQSIVHLPGEERKP